MEELSQLISRRVGFLLSPAAMENVLHVEKISPRIKIADFKGNPTTTIISCYSPHNSSNEEELKDFYNIMRSTLEHVPAHNFLLVAGDFNAKLGADDAKFTYHLETNRNGDHLVHLAQEFSLLAANTRFKKVRTIYGPLSIQIAVEPNLTLLWFVRNGRIASKTVEHIHLFPLLDLIIELSPPLSNLA